MLDAANAVAADNAVAQVEAAVAKLQAAVNARSWVLTFVTGSQSTAAAEDESLRQSKKILDQLRTERPDLTNEGLGGFLELAAAGGSVQASVDAAQLATGSGFAANVVAPTIAGVKSLAGTVGLGVGGLLAIVAAVFGLLLFLKWDRT